MSGEDLRADTVAVLDRIRDARFSAGVRCPRCGSAHVIRWGGFSSRRRYRCATCQRTFSDLTGTPAAYSKKIWLWGRYAQCMAQGASVRRSAHRIGVAPTTAFRWRHAILDELVVLDAATLSGIIEIGDLWFAYSRKGERNLSDPPRRRGPGSRVMFPRRKVVRVIVAADRTSRVVTDVVLSHIVSLPDLVEALHGRIQEQPLLLAAQGRLGPVGRFARRLKGKFVDVRGGVAFRPGTLWHLRTMRGYSRRLISWIERFRGVATKYLENYLIWHRIVDAAERFDPAAVVLKWCLSTGFT